MKEENKKITYRHFTTREEADDLAGFIKEQGLDCEVVDNKIHFDVSFSNNPLLNTYLVTLHSSDFEKANVLLQQFYDNAIEDLPEEHYLFQFSDDELMGILKSPHEWNSFDYVMARKILESKGVSIDDSQIKTYQQEKIEELSKPAESEHWMVYAGYAFSLLNFYPTQLFFWVAALSAIIGVVLIFHKNTLPNGNRIFAYSGKQRIHGYVIIALTIASFIWYFIYLFWIL